MKPDKKPVSRQTKAILSMIQDKNRLWKENAELRKRVVELERALAQLLNAGVAGTKE